MGATAVAAATMSIRRPPLPSVPKRHPDLALVVAAGGSATRFGSNKLLAFLQGKPVFLHCLYNLAPLACETILVTPKEQQTVFQNFLKEAGLTEIQVVVGGDSRVASVLAGLHAISPKTTFVAVQDAARPLTSRDIFERCAESARAYGSGVAAHRVVDTIKIADQQALVLDTPDRSSLWAAETPQTFRRDWLQASLEQCLATGQLVTDDAHAIQISGHPVHLVENSAPNPKITIPNDLALVEFLMAHSFKN